MKKIMNKCIVIRKNTMYMHNYNEYSEEFKTPKLN